jgi:hypothetical protein
MHIVFGHPAGKFEEAGRKRTVDDFDDGLETGGAGIVREADDRGGETPAPEGNEYARARGEASQQLIRNAVMEGFIDGNTDGYLNDRD